MQYLIISLFFIKKKKRSVGAAFINNGVTVLNSLHLEMIKSVGF